MKAIYLGLVAVLGAGVAAATTINLSTNSTNSDDYTIQSDTNGGPDGTTVFENPSLPPAPFAHVGSVTDSDGITSTTWIAPAANQDTEPNTISGTTVYELQFTLPSFSSVSLAMTLAADDFVSVTLNGVTIFSPDATQMADGMWSAADEGTVSPDVTTGFNVGNNILLFTVPNNTTDGAGTNCCGDTGLLVAADVNYTASTTPEPATLAITGLGLLGMAYLLRRRVTR